MKQFTTLLEAAEFAVILCGSWSFATSNDRYDVEGLLVLAQTSDSENSIGEDGFYVVSHAGAIGLCEGGEDVDWLFLSDASPNEDLPARYQVDLKSISARNAALPPFPALVFVANEAID